MGITVITAGIAVVSSTVAMILLRLVAIKIGGHLGKMLKFLLVGIFFAVFVHSIAELADVFNIISGYTLMITMGILLTLGSTCFICASYFGFKAIK
ncbi:MAG: hypothetical protein COV71_05175 [Candidatus Omnitrophica bacterium CG11_big_fil_rev_8_21_14_0_20_41_12]|nr:MAG: hypothetical protein COV71_05175 [Candidatus Omnitrophica bacterium CG11_big_fil_rev_8_21_14_0_20_41_12]